MSRTKHYFISDLHLGASYVPDVRAHEERVVNFLRAIEDEAKTLYLLGDVLDYWFEYKTVVPRGYVRFFGQLARMADAGTEIVWFIGNHDIWLFDYLRDEIGIRVVNTNRGGVFQRIEGTEFFLGHGDTFGRQPRSYMLMRSLFHNSFCQKLYSSIHPRWTIPFAHRWSSYSRKVGTRADAAFDAQARTSTEMYARELCESSDSLRYIIIGHHHVSVDESIAPGCRLIILGDWIEGGTYAVFDGCDLRLCTC